MRHAITDLDKAQALLDDLEPTSGGRRALKAEIVQMRLEEQIAQLLAANSQMQCSSPRKEDSELTHQIEVEKRLAAVRKTAIFDPGETSQTTPTLNARVLLCIVVSSCLICALVVFVMRRV